MDNPKYTAAMFIPMAFPRSCGGNIEVMIANEVTKIIAEPTPCNILKIMRAIAEGAIAESKDAMVKIIIP